MNRAGGLRSALRELVETLRPHIRLTPQRNVLIANVAATDRTVVGEILARWQVMPSESVPTTIRDSMACPAWPTCGLAVAESERVMPVLIRDITVLQRDAGLQDSRISYRMPGCPNGCARQGPAHLADRHAVEEVGA